MTIFKTKSSKFWMVVDLDNTHRLYHTKPNTTINKIVANQQFLQLGPPNCAWQQIELISRDHTTLCHTILYHTKPNTTINIIVVNQTFFKLGAPNFTWQQIQTIPTDHTTLYQTNPYQIPQSIKQTIPTDHTILQQTIPYHTIPNTTTNEIVVNRPFLKLELQILRGSRSR